MNIVVTGLCSDAHTWNLVYLQLALEEAGNRVTNLGACVTAQDVIASSSEGGVDVLVVSTVNGHGLHDSLELIRAVRACEATSNIHAVVGGKLTLDGRLEPHQEHALIDAGFDRVFAPAATSTDLVDHLAMCEPAGLAG